MRSSAVADTFSVERTRKPAKPAAKPVAPRKPAAPRKRAPKPAVATVTPPPAEPASSPADRGRRRRRLAFASAGLVVVVAGSFAAGLVFLRGDGGSGGNQAGVRAAISAEELASFASSHDGPVYWAGPILARKLELTATRAGTFVRYLPLSAAVGDAARTTTVATYPLRNAYATAVARAKNAQMTSRATAAGGVVVWNLTSPTSVYLAFPGVPQLVEVYSPDAETARALALSGRVRPVR
jgi:hypothetical protein